MKIGILTFANVPNFGANLQAFSTICYLRKNGHLPIIIKWEPFDFDARFDNIRNNKQPQEHFRFVQEYLPQTQICRTDEDICRTIDEEKIDAIIIGSDAVLQCSSLWGRIDFPTKSIFRINKLTSERKYPNAFWGTFYAMLGKKIPMVIMSAPSQNAKYKLISSKVKKRMYENLQNFEYISVRDSWTQSMICNITKNMICPTITPDPVFAFNYNCSEYIPAKDDILKRYNLPSNYLLVSMKSRMLDNDTWMSELKSKSKSFGLECVALPMPTGIDFRHNFDYSINVPLSPLDWYALIKYAKGYVGENMHPIVVALHNSVPCFCFDTYGVLKYGKCICVEKSSKIYDIMKCFGVLNNRINAYSRFWKVPTVDYILKRILEFDKLECEKISHMFYHNYQNMMNTIIYKLRKK